jgi:hypothetical protein
MRLAQVFDRFVQKAPAAVMVRAAMENILAPERLDQIFVDTAQRQYARTLAFSAVATLMAEVVMRSRRSLYAAFRAYEDQLPVKHKCVYNKVNGIEPQVSAAMVRRTAWEMAEVIESMGGQRPALLPGFRVKVLDGNHLSASEHRIGALRDQPGAALPGRTVVVLDPRLMLAVDEFPIEDGHASERTVLPQVLETVQPLDLWLGDRNFCTRDFALGIAARGAFFLIRQHAQNLPLDLVGERTHVGRSETGEVFEQTALARAADGSVVTLRRITVELFKANRDGDRVLNLVTNAPSERVDAITLADLYRQRWLIENAFYELTVELSCEVNTLGYPSAALFGFSLALVCYNIFSVVQAALRAEHGSERIANELSSYYLVDHVAGAWQGMLIAIPEAEWQEPFASLTASELGIALRELASHINLTKLRKSHRGPKKPKPKIPKTPHHFSNAKVIPGYLSRRNC